MKSTLKLFKFLKPYWRWAALAPFLMMLEVAMDLLQPRMVERIVDEGIAKLNLPLIWQTGALMVGLAILGAIGGVTNGIFTEISVQGFGADLREFLIRKVQSFSFANLDRLETGQLITRLTNDVTQVQEAIMMLLRIMVRSPLLLVGSLIMAIITSPKLAFIPLVLMPIELLAVIWVINKATPLFTKVQARLDGLNQVMQENLAGVRLVKAFVRGPFEETRFKGANEALASKAIQAGRTVAVMMPFMSMTMNLGIISVLWFGGIQVVQGSLMVGQIIAFVNYLMTTLFSLVMVSSMMIQLARAEASASRIIEVIDNVPAVANRPQAKVDFQLSGQVTFDNVTFAYQNGNAPGEENEAVLKGISFSAQPGETVALLGMTGSGKSSLVNLIPRFYDVTGGKITLDGIDVRDLDQAVLRRQVGIALQETVLFSGSIRENICYGRPEASQEEVEAAARAAQAHDFIVSFPDGYDTLLGQRGVNLSGGQKQRIAIARALLIDPAILIFDDSTSAVDIETEVKIQSAMEGKILKRPQAQRTILVVAQRISTVLTADKILVLDDGKIAAQGNHQHLIASSPIYREIYESQLGNGGLANV